MQYPSNLHNYLFIINYHQSIHSQSSILPYQFRLPHHPFIFHLFTHSFITTSISPKYSQILISIFPKMPMGNGTMHKMWMYFHTEINDTLLFSFWTIKTEGAMILACLLLFFAAFFFELLKWFRLVMEQKGNGRQLAMASTRLTNGTSSTNRRYADSLLSSGHLLQTALFSLQLFLSYLLMLAIMTFSLWILFAICAGAAFGFWIFGRRQPVLASTNGRPNPEIH